MMESVNLTLVSYSAEKFGNLMLQLQYVLRALSRKYCKEEMVSDSWAMEAKTLFFLINNLELTPMM